MVGADLFREGGVAEAGGAVVESRVAVPLRIAGGHRGGGAVHLLFDNCYLLWSIIVQLSLPSSIVISVPRHTDDA